MVRIFCEGSDDKSFLRLLLNDLKKDKEIVGFENFDSVIKVMGGKSKLLDSDSYQVTNKRVGKDIQRVLFVFDCDFLEDDSSCGGLKNSIKAIEELISSLYPKKPFDFSHKNFNPLKQKLKNLFEENQ